jgi:hypothetical protein
VHLGRSGAVVLVAVLAAGEVVHHLVREGQGQRKNVKAQCIEENNTFTMGTVSLCMSALFSRTKTDLLYFPRLHSGALTKPLPCCSR